MSNKPKTLRCAIYTRKSSEEGLEQEFNSLHAQREACEAYILSQKHEGWNLLPQLYDDGGFSGGNMNRPALVQLMGDIERGVIDVIVVYKVDRLTRSLTDFAKLVEVMDKHQVSFVSVTQQFNTTTSMGRLTLNVLLSFAQFEREVTGERIRDKIALSKQKGKWMGGVPPLGYDSKDQKLVVNDTEAITIRHIFGRYLTLQSVNLLKAELDAEGYCTKRRTFRNGKTSGGLPFSKGNLYRLLQNRVYIGEIVHKDKSYPGEHKAIIESTVFDKVQSVITQNRMKQKGAVGAKSPCLLAGKLYDDAGHYMTPKHSRTRKRHYRYYTSQAIIQSRSHEAGSLPNIPAGEIEALVKSEIYAFLRNHEKLQPVLAELPIDQQQQLLEQTNDLDLSTDQEHIFIRSLISKIILSDVQVEIVLCAKQLLTSLQMIQRDESITQEADTETDTPITLIRKVKLAKTNNGSKVITGSIATGCNMQLVKAITRSFLWNQQLINGEHNTIQEIATQNGITSPTYATRIMRLQFLAPDIIASILEGIHHTDWTVEKLFSINTHDWHEQRQLLGLN